jgi:hypothetical protein
MALTIIVVDDDRVLTRRAHESDGRGRPASGGHAEFVRGSVCVPPHPATRPTRLPHLIQTWQNANQAATYRWVSVNSQLHNIYSICDGTDTGYVMVQIQYMWWYTADTVYVMVHSSYSICDGTQHIQYIWWYTIYTVYMMVHNIYSIYVGTDTVFAMVLFVCLLIPLLDRLVNPILSQLGRMPTKLQRIGKYQSIVECSVTQQVQYM